MSLYLSLSEISASAREITVLNPCSQQIALDHANDGWLDLSTNIVSDRYVSDIRVVHCSLDGAARYASAVKLLRELRAAQTSHHPHKNAA